MYQSVTNSPSPSLLRTYVSSSSILETLGCETCSFTTVNTHVFLEFSRIARHHSKARVCLLDRIEHARVDAIIGDGARRRHYVFLVHSYRHDILRRARESLSDHSVRAQGGLAFSNLVHDGIDVRDCLRTLLVQFAVVRDRSRARVDERGVLQSTLNGRDIQLLQQRIARVRSSKTSALETHRRRAD